MKLLTQLAVMTCAHQMGIVGLLPSQAYVSVEGRRVLVAPDPVGKPILGCPNIGPTLKPCTSTLPVKTGYSSFVRVSGRAVCLDTVRGLTDGTPPGLVEYMVQTPGQAWVSVSG